MGSLKITMHSYQFYKKYYLALRNIGNIDLGLVGQYVQHLSCIFRKKLHRIVVVQIKDYS